MSLERLRTEIDEEAERLRASESIPADLNEELQRTFNRYVRAIPRRRRGERLRDAISRARRASEITHHADPSSDRPVSRALKRLVWRVIAWALEPTALRATDFARANLEVLELAADRIEDYEMLMVEMAENPRVVRERVEVLWQMWERMGGVRLDERLARLERAQRHLGRRDSQDLEAERASGEEAEGGRAGRRAGAAKTEMLFDYYLFQLAHRGGPEMVEERIRRYLPHFKGAQDVLDLGCGRGEFIEAFRDAGIRAYGIEIHPDMVAHCRERRLEVLEGDGIEHLRGLAPGSLGGIFLGQVVEHLTPAELVELVELSSEVLRPGGVFLAETVNPTCLGSFAHAFYIDLSHDKPVHPTTMQFLLESSGFTGIAFEWMFPFPEDQRLKTLSGEEPWAEVLNENLEKLNRLLYGPHDYAVIARKPK